MCWDVPVVRPMVAETTALGAAYAAGYGRWLLEEHQTKCVDNWGIDKTWEPTAESNASTELYRDVEEGSHPHIRLGRISPIVFEQAWGDIPPGLSCLGVRTHRKLRDRVCWCGLYSDPREVSYRH